jgi:hypothetical protein
VLADLDLTHELTEGGAVSGTVLSGDSDLLRALAHLVLFICNLKIDNCIGVEDKGEGSWYCEKKVKVERKTRAALVNENLHVTPKLFFLFVGATHRTTHRSAIPIRGRK